MARTSKASGSLDVYAFATHYPSTYKSYYDELFAEFIDAGHRLTIFALEPQGLILSGLVRDYALHRRTHYLLPDAPLPALRLMPRIVAGTLRRPLTRLPRARAAARWSARPRARMKHALRMLALPARAPDLCCVQSHETMGLVPWLKDIYPRTRVALHYHGGLPAEAGTIDIEVTRRAFASADVVFAPTAFAREEAIALGSPPERTTILPTGFRMRGLEPIARTPGFGNGRAVRLISAGRLSEGKGHLVALAALAAVRARDGFAFHYEIVGSGPMLPTLEGFVTDHGLGEVVTLRGSLPHEALLERMGAADVLLLPSIPTASWNETQGAVMQEALLRGALVIASRTGGIPESLPPFLHRFLVPPNDPAALARCLEDLTAMAGDDVAQLLERAEQWVRERYDNRLLLAELLRRALAAR